MAYRLTLLYREPKSEQDVPLASTEDPTDDPVVAFAQLRIMQSEVMGFLKQDKRFRKVRDEQFTRRIDRIDLQLPLGAPVMNGGH